MVDKDQYTSDGHCLSITGELEGSNACQYTKMYQYMLMFIGFGILVIVYLLLGTSGGAIKP